MKVLILAGHAKSLVNFRAELILRFLDLGATVFAAAPDLSASEVEKAWLERHGVSCVDLPLARAGLNPLADTLYFFRLLRIVHDILPGLLFAYTIKPVVWGVAAAWVFRVPRRVALITGLGYAFSDSNSIKRRLVGMVAKTLYSISLWLSSLVIFQNHDDQAEMIR